MVDSQDVADAFVVDALWGCQHAPSDGVVWYGCQGHLCVRCWFHLHTHYGSWCLSTVGDYVSATTNKRETLGLGDNSYYETMLFDNASKDGRWEEQMTRRYATEEEAHLGHYQALDHLMDGGSPMA